MNYAVLSIFIMIVLCLLKLNIMLSMFISAIICGVLSQMPFEVSLLKSLFDTTDLFVSGMSSNIGNAFSYIMLGALAVALNESGITGHVSKFINSLNFKKASLLVLFIAFISCFSQNLIPIHIAFIPIIIPPIIATFNKLNIDRRAIACALTFGLKAPYIVFPVGFGLVFHKMIADNMIANNMEVNVEDVYKSLIIPALGMFVGLLIAIFFTYKKERIYKDIPIESSNHKVEAEKIPTVKLVGAFLGAAATFAIQIADGSLALGALFGILIMLAFGTIKYDNINDVISKGINLMGSIAFVIIVAGGFAEVIQASGGLQSLAEYVTLNLAGSKFIVATVLLLVGLLITMGIGSSFSTIPIIAVFYVPICQGVGFSTAATVCLIGVAAALGDAGSPASDSTLGPTAGLNVDGQHDHIRDTCIPTFLHFNIPLLIFGVIGAMVL